MASGMTNRGRFLLLGYAFRATTLPTNYYLALVTSAVAPTVDSNTMAALTEIAAGNGYAAGGYQLEPGVVDFDVQTEDDSGDQAFVQLKDIVWTASGGPLPASGDGARYAVLTDDNATPANRQIIGFYDLVSDKAVSDGQTFTMQDGGIKFTKPA